MTPFLDTHILTHFWTHFWTHFMGPLPVIIDVFDQIKGVIL